MYFKADEDLFKLNNSSFMYLVVQMVCNK